jgi:hypothetical protein
MGIVLAVAAASRYLPVVPIDTTIVMTLAAVVGLGAGRLLAASEQLARTAQPQAAVLLRFGRGGLVAALALCAAAGLLALS